MAWRKGSLQEMVLGILDIRMQKNYLDPHLISYVKINSKCFFNINIKSETVNLPAETTGENCVVVIWSVLFTMCFEKHMQWEQKHKWNYIKLKIFCKAKEINQ
jgi:hypothetical protein